MATSPTRPQPFPAPRLSRNGLIVAMVVMICTPVALVTISFLMFPENDPRELPVRILTDGYVGPAAVQASIEASRDGGGEILEPYLEVQNVGDEPLSSLFVTVNKRFVFHSAQPLEPGEVQVFFLSRLQEPDGSRFWPNKYDIDRVIVKARLPSRKQAVYEATWQEILERAAESEGGSASADDSPRRDADPEAASPEASESSSDLEAEPEDKADAESADDTASPAR